MTQLRADIKQLALSVKGFLAEAEGLRLFEIAVASSRQAPCLEIGSYCGKSTIFIAEGCRLSAEHPLFAVDHHRGSAEQQLGQPYFDSELFDHREGVVNTFNHFTRNVRRAALTDWVIPIVADSRRVSRYWPAVKLSLLFIDGGHSEADAFGDFDGWQPHVISGGYLCIHDIFTDPAKGGQAPYHVLEHALATNDWEFVDLVESLGVLRCK